MLQVIDLGCNKCQGASWFHDLRAAVNSEVSLMHVDELVEEADEPLLELQYDSGFVLLLQTH